MPPLAKLGAYLARQLVSCLEAQRSPKPSALGAGCGPPVAVVGFWLRMRNRDNGIKDVAASALGPEQDAGGEMANIAAPALRLEAGSFPMVSKARISQVEISI